MEHSSPSQESTEFSDMTDLSEASLDKPTRPAPNSEALRELAELEGKWRENHPIKIDASPEEREEYDNTAFMQAQRIYNLASFGGQGGPYTPASARERQIIANEVSPEGTVENERLEQAANIDILTGVGSRLAFEQALIKRTEYESSCSIISLDIDNFKSLNDGYNHIIGDAGLRFFANIIIQASEDEGISRRSIFRPGGDEFALIIDEDPNQSKGNAIINRIKFLLSHAYSDLERQKEVLPGLDQSQTQVNIGKLKDLGLGISGGCASSYEDADKELMERKKVQKSA